MLSYQHSYHAGNLADVHKHAVLSSILSYLTQKDKPVTYLESHSGRGLYDLQSSDATKTGEAEQGIARQAVLDWFPVTHPYRRVLAGIRLRHGESAYPGSPFIASELLRDSDSMHLGELHPGEFDRLGKHLSPRARVYQEDGYQLLNRLCPPTPRRGLALLDPSYEVAEDYARTVRSVKQLATKWNVGVVMVWYPVLKSGAERSLVRDLQRHIRDGISHQVQFPPAKDGHGMIGSGLFIIRPPYGLDAELQRLSACYQGLSRL